jgi:hypothetical protein
MKTGMEYVVNGNEVLRIDYDCLDPNGEPTITVLNQEEINELNTNK